MRFLPEEEAVSRSAEDEIAAGETARNYVRNVQAVAALASPAAICVALQPALATIRKPLSPEEKQILAREEQQIPGYAQRVQAAYAAMHAEIESAGIPRIELNNALGSDPELLFADECHFGDAAAERIAEVIVEKLGEMGLSEIDIGRLSPAFPVTPPDMRVHIRRFGGLSHRLGASLGTPSESK
jgi:lysophospholipase L1-like esterase